MRLVGYSMAPPELARASSDHHDGSGRAIAFLANHSSDIAGTRDRLVAIARPSRAREEMQARGAPASRAWIWAIGAARDSAVGTVRRHLGTSSDAPRGLLLRSGG
jgi:hypothetical protein